MIEVKRNFEKIKNESSTNQKKKYVSECINNKDFEYTLRFLLDDNIITGLSTKKINKKVKPIESEFKNFIEVCEYVKAHNTGTDAVIGVVKDFIQKQPDDMQDFYKDVLTKSYKLGLTKKSINDIVPNFFDIHEVMLASSFTGELNKAVVMTLKLDGIRCSAIIENGNITFKSRQGKEILGLNEIEESLKAIGSSDVFLDGELIRKNVDNLPSDENFRLTTQIVNSDSLDKRGLEFVIFDTLSLEEYRNKKCECTYAERTDYMDFMVHYMIGTNVRLVECFGITNDVDEVYECLDRVTSKGYEGLMLNTLDGMYEFGKRSKGLMKVKKFKNADVLVVGVEEGTGRLKDTLGALRIQFKYKDVVYENSLGSGFTDEEREHFWNHQDQIIGKVIEIKYFEISKNKQGDIGFRFPTWKGREYIRFDKSGIDDTNVED